MTRQLVDVLYDASFDIDIDINAPWVTSNFVASLLADGPAEHTIDCPTCEGSGMADAMAAAAASEFCPDCTNGRRTVRIGVLP